ncbi:SgcJ/EcaC family oxidoreductase [Streptomyces luteolus]|uniref:SgcJ/EcaC family oxidoreductase n=1 Tax=Streptomyces luteolus TaxID=3043615 RepID=A0ABT6T458_9ACTN|nr:SgcJ/EcaC family oxidoreductase [Streptomyces sp. B-S-A12]MDI3422653.1 SgcJ/EcaC family oxidoreductase [Streptomyces sp. B-S-A12]
MTSVHVIEEAGTPSGEEEVAEVVARYEAAFNQNDARTMNDLFSPDTIFVNFSGNLVFGADRLYQAQSFVFGEGGPLADITVSYTVESIAFLTPEVAVAHARQRSAGADRQTQIGSDPMEGILAMTLMPDASGQWRIRMAQNTPVAAR